MPTAFTDAADFAAMTDDASDLKISAVMHQTFIAVDEHGTEAAAATAVAMQAVSMPQYTDVVVDRPFLFVIHDVEHADPALPRPGGRPLGLLIGVWGVGGAAYSGARTPCRAGPGAICAVHPILRSPR